MLCHKLMDGLKNWNSNQLETQEVMPGWDPRESFYDRASLQKYRRPPEHVLYANCYGSFTGGHTLRRPVNKKTWSQWEPGR